MTNYVMSISGCFRWKTKFNHTHFRSGMSKQKKNNLNYHYIAYFGLAGLLYNTSLCTMKISCALFSAWILAELTGLAHYLGTHPFQTSFC